VYYRSTSINDAAEEFKSYAITRRISSSVCMIARVGCFYGCLNASRFNLCNGSVLLFKTDISSNVSIELAFTFHPNG